MDGTFLTRKLCCVRSRIRPMQNLNLIVISVAVAHKYAQFKNHCTRRKGNVKAQPTNPKMLKMKRQHEKLKLSKYHRARHVFYFRNYYGGSKERTQSWSTSPRLVLMIKSSAVRQVRIPRNRPQQLSQRLSLLDARRKRIICNCIEGTSKKRRSKG